MGLRVLHREQKVKRSRADVLRARACLLEQLAEIDRELAALEHGSDGPLVDVLAVLPGPRRSILAACRTGAIASASKLGRRWCAPQSAIDDFLRARGPRVVQAHDRDEDDLEDLRRELSRAR